MGARLQYEKPLDVENGAIGDGALWEGAGSGDYDGDGEDLHDLTCLIVKLTGTKMRQLSDILVVFRRMDKMFFYANSDGTAGAAGRNHQPGAGECPTETSQTGSGADDHTSTAAPN